MYPRGLTLNFSLYQPGIDFKCPYSNCPLKRVLRCACATCAGDRRHAQPRVGRTHLPARQRAVCVLHMPPTTQVEGEAVVAYPTPLTATQLSLAPSSLYGDFLDANWTKSDSGVADELTRPFSRRPPNPSHTSVARTEDLNVRRESAGAVRRSRAVLCPGAPCQTLLVDSQFSPIAVAPSGSLRGARLGGECSRRT
jgi:hypothetical protein